MWRTLWETDCETLRIDETGVYDPELDVRQDDENSGRTYTYTVCLERLYRVEDDDSVYYVTRTIAEGYKAGTLPHAISCYKEWFYDDLASVANSIGSTRASLLALLCSENPSDLANAYYAIAEHHGWDNFDSDPRLGWIDEKMPISLSQSDDDDGMVTVYCEDQERAREDQSIEGSHWECPRDMSVAYATIMDRPGLVADLEKAGYEVDDSDYSKPDEADLAYWHACNVAANAGLPKPKRPE